jgi:hypothetical protein
MTGQSPDTLPNVPRVFAWLTKGRDGLPWSPDDGGKPALLIDAVDSRFLKVKDVTARDLPATCSSWPARRSP